MRGKKVTRPACRYSAKEHRYEIAGIGCVPSVSQVLKESGRIDTQWFTAEDALRGTAVHEFIAQWIAGKPIFSAAKYALAVQEYSGYVQSFKRFMADTQFKVLHSEKKVWSVQHRFAGRCDLVGRLHGMRVVTDIKTGSVHDWHGLQLAGYRVALLEGGIHTEAGYILQLNADGEYKLINIKCGVFREGVEFLGLLKEVWRTPRWQQVNMISQLQKKSRPRLKKNARNSRSKPQRSPLRRQSKPSSRRGSATR